MKAPLPSFAEATDRFRVFLREQGHVAALLWVRPTDVALVRQTLFFCRPVSDARALETYQTAQAGLGHVRFNAVARSRTHILATIRAAMSEDEAGDHWIRGTTFSARRPLLHAAWLPSRALLSLAQRVFPRLQEHLLFVLGLEPFVPAGRQSTPAV